MFSEILKIIPKLDGSSLNAMEKALGSRFGNLAKKFGKGLAASLAGGGIAGIAIGVIDKLLNPLKEVQETINNSLKNGAEVVNQAKQFGTTSGKLFKLQQLGKASGIDPGELNVLIEKFQTAVAQAVQDPLKQTSVRNFVGEKDTAQAFFEFIQGLQKMDKTSQNLVQNEVFGEKQILRMAEFLNGDFGKQTKLIGAKSAETYTPGLEKLDSLNNLSQALDAKRTLGDTLTKSSLINKGMVTQQAAAAQLSLDKENARLKSYDSLAAISDGTDKIIGIIEGGLLKLTDLVTKVTNLSETVKNFSGSKLLRGIFGGGDK